MVAVEELVNLIGQQQIRIYELQRDLDEANKVVQHLRDTNKQMKSGVSSLLDKIKEG